MRATDLLREQHRQIDDLFEELDAAGRDDEERAEVFDLVGARLAARALVERELFEPACLKSLGAVRQIDTWAVHRREVASRLYDAAVCPDREWPRCVTRLRAAVFHHHHAAADLYAQLEPRVTQAELDELGLRMERKFNLALTVDLRAMLHSDPFEHQSAVEQAAPVSTPLN